MGGRKRGKLQGLNERKRVKGRWGEDGEKDGKEPGARNNEGTEEKVEETEKERGMSTNIGKFYWFWDCTGYYLVRWARGEGIGVVDFRDGDSYCYL